MRSRVSGCRGGSTASDALIASRAIDETGYVQPTREALIAVRGTNSNYHYNGIKFWNVRADGTVAMSRLSRRWSPGGVCARLARRSRRRFGVGRPPTPEEIRELGSAIAPDGTGLPAGIGLGPRPAASCSPPSARDVTDPRRRRRRRALVGGRGTLRTPRPLKTVGSFWPYATTLWDYVNRAMPFDQPGRLTAPEVYAAVAYVLNLNGIIAADRVMDATSLPEGRRCRIATGSSPIRRPDVH